MQLYYIAHVLPPPAAAVIDDYRRWLCENFGCCHALRSPPHITLIAPFRATNETRLEVVDRLGKTIPNRSAFELQSPSFAVFGRRTLFASLAPSPQLSALQAAVVAAMTGLPIPPSKLPFHPHITLANRDLESCFDAVWPLFVHKALDLRWKCHSVSMLRHTAHGWEVLETVEM